MRQLLAVKVPQKWLRCGMETPQLPGLLQADHHPWLTTLLESTFKLWLKYKRSDWTWPPCSQSISCQVFLPVTQVIKP